MFVYSFVEEYLIPVPSDRKSIRLRHLQASMMSSHLGASLSLEDGLVGGIFFNWHVSVSLMRYIT